MPGTISCGVKSPGRRWTTLNPRTGEFRKRRKITSRWCVLTYLCKKTVTLWLRIILTDTLSPLVSVMKRGMPPLLWSIVLLTLCAQLLSLVLILFLPQFPSAIPPHSSSSFFFFCFLFTFFFFLFFFFLFFFFSSSSPSSSSATFRRAPNLPIQSSSIPDGLRPFPDCFTFTLHLNHSLIRSSNFTLSPSFSCFYCSWCNFLTFVRLVFLNMTITT